MDSIIQQIRHFHQSPTTAKLRDQLRQKTILDIWGVGRRENGHSNFLAWILTPSESHDMGFFAIQKLLQLLTTLRLTPEQQLPDSLQYAILSGKSIIRTAKVKREVSIPSSKERVDIVIDIELTQELKEIQRLQIVLENKIDAAETNNQTVRYYQHFSKRQDKKLFPIFVYLCRIQALPCQDVHFIRINYQQIMDYLLTPALQRENMPQYTQLLLKEYVKHLSYFNSDSLCIAMNEQQRNLLIKFWDENSALMSACVQAISEDPDTSPEIREKSRNILKLCKKVNQRDRTKYVCRNPDGHCTDPIGKGRMVLHVIRSYVEETDCTYEQLKVTFSPKWLEKEEEVKTKKQDKRFFLSDDERITLKNGETIAVSSQCGKGKSLINFDDFVKKAERLGYVITAKSN